MPTYAGFIMNVENQFNWIKENCPDVDTTGCKRPSFAPVMNRLRELKVIDRFILEPVVVPQPNPETLDPDAELSDYLGFMLARRVCTDSVPSWLPPREGPGVSDGKTERFLRRHGFDGHISDWVVIFQPEHDPLRAFYVRPPSCS